jgi:hypothetical protein
MRRLRFVLIGLVWVLLWITVGFAIGACEDDTPKPGPYTRLDCYDDALAADVAPDVWLKFCFDDPAVGEVIDHVWDTAMEQGREKGESEGKGEGFRRGWVEALTLTQECERENYDLSLCEAITCTLDVVEIPATPRPVDYPTVEQCIGILYDGP